MTTRALTFRFSGWSGWHTLCALLPWRWQARIVARAWVRTLGSGIDLGATEVLVELPCGTFRVVTRGGRCVPAVSRALGG